MSIVEDWRVEAHIRRMRRDMWWRRLGLLLICASTWLVVLACYRIVTWLCGVQW